MNSLRFFPFCFVMLTACVCASDAFFGVLDNESNSVFGTIISLDEMQIVIDVQGEFQAIPLEKVVKIRNLAPSPYEGTPADSNAHLPAQSTRSRRNTNEQRFSKLLEEIQQSNEQVLKKTFPSNVVSLEFKDGSRWTASSFTVAKNQGTCRLLDQPNDVLVPLNHISAVRFAVRNLLDSINPPPDWLRLAVPNAEGDRLIVGNSGSFDVYSGILQDITAETIFFSVDGEVLPVPRRRVFGLVLHDESALPASLAPLASLSLWTGTRAMVSNIRLNDHVLSWQSTGGLTAVTPLNMVSEIDFGEKGVAYLIDFERVRNEFSLPLASDTTMEQLKLLQTFYKSRTKVSREIVLDGTAYDRGVTLFGKTSLEYHLPKPFAALKAVIGIEDQFRPFASATLQIVADTHILGTWVLRGDGASQRIHLKLPQHCRLISIFTEPSPQSIAPAVLTIADPKLFE